MTKSKKSRDDLVPIQKQIDDLHQSLVDIKANFTAPDSSVGERGKFVKKAGALMTELQRIREQVSPVHFGSIGITLGRAASIAKFFAFSFVNQKKRNLAKLEDSPFYGSGVYAIYYHGKSNVAYKRLSGKETPIYVGKANPADTYAETVEAQGKALYSRLMEHAKNIDKTGLCLNDFRYRAAAIQSGMQAAVEDFMIHLFQPIWNKEIKICYGIGKHGDSAKTRSNKRSPWDTMHPGRSWAAATTSNQMELSEIKKKIAAHFKAHPVIPNTKKLFKLLSLE